jgi:hypothetical protein
VNGRGVNLAMISRSLKGQTPFYKGVRGVEVSSDILSWCLMAVFLDTEGDVSRALVMLEARWCWRCGSSSWLAYLSLLQVSGALGIRYWLGSVTSALTSALTSSVAYTQPFGSDVGGDAKTFCDDRCKLFSIIVGWRNLSGILVVLLEAVDKASCQCCGLRMTEVKSRHAVGRNGS